MNKKDKQEVVYVLCVIQKALEEREQLDSYWGNRLNELLDKHNEYSLDGSPFTSQGVSNLNWAMNERGESPLDLMMLAEAEYQEWSRVFDEQNELLTEEEYDSLLKQQAYEDEQEYVRTAGYPI